MCQTNMKIKDVWWSNLSPQENDMLLSTEINLADVTWSRFHHSEPAPVPMTLSKASARFKLKWTIIPSYVPNGRVWRLRNDLEVSDCVWILNSQLIWITKGSSVIREPFEHECVLAISTILCTIKSHGCCFIELQLKVRLITLQP